MGHPRIHREGRAGIKDRDESCSVYMGLKLAQRESVELGGEKGRLPGNSQVTACWTQQPEGDPGGAPSQTEGEPVFLVGTDLGGPGPP